MAVSDKCVMVSNDADLNKVLRVNNRVITLFHTTWCPFCRDFLPIFKGHAVEELLFLCIQDDQKAIADKYSVKVYPTVLFFENGSVSKRLDGAVGVGLDEEQLADFMATI